MLRRGLRAVGLTWDGAAALPAALTLAIAGVVLVASGLSGRQAAEPSAMLQMSQIRMLRQQGVQVAPQSLFGGWSTVTPEQFDGRCRCTGYKTYNPDQRVVCASQVCLAAITRISGARGPGRS